MSNGHLDAEAPAYHNHDDKTKDDPAIAGHDAANNKPLANQDISDAIFLVVMGVSGTGKSTLGNALSKALHIPFVDGDDLHPQSNVAKMSRCEPLTDADRQPWLETIRKTAPDTIIPQAEMEKTLSENECSTVGQGEDKKLGIIVACSSLKKTYRSVLRGESLSEGEMLKHSGGIRTYFVYMKGSREVLVDRMMKRQGHFMKAAMLDSQLATLESPENEEGVVTVSIGWSTEDQVREVVRALKLEAQ
ncbi:carbohydrate kinase [Rhizopogon vinicolor AM-OR11-026]|uniref:gluconokinase n=1 Tax=Rhizopogon vinicolor AM-OR11-026 TaxID=1314800 RepID=A0A1B7MVF8_9AGAM|nr:carbohydrate kinase [Rhizopogon vinicolor AM-OR11-026]